VKNAIVKITSHFFAVYPHMIVANILFKSLISPPCSSIPTNTNPHLEETAQEFSQNDVSRLVSSELAVVKSMCPLACVSAFLYTLDNYHPYRMSPSC